jgi:hypothetical protein
MTHRITDAERAVLARVPATALFALASPQKRLPRSLFAEPQLLTLTLQRLALARMKAGEFCLLTRSAP